MKRVFLVLAIAFVQSCISKKVEISANQENNRDYSPEIQRQIEMLHAGKIQNLVLPKGKYHFYPDGSVQKELYISNHDQDNPKQIGFYLENLKNVVIDGKGSEFIFHGTMLPFVLKNCENVTLQNFSIDFELPHLRQLTILEADATNDVVRAKIEPSGNYHIQDEKLVISVGEYRFTPQWVMAFSEDKRLTYRRADVDFNTKSVREIAPDILEIKGWSQNKLTKKGERFVLRSYHRPTPSIFIDYSKNISLKNVSVHYAYGMGLLAQMSENITLDGFSTSIKQGSERYFTLQADATHFSGCKGLIKSVNGLYEGMGDDAINVHGTYLKVMKKTHSNRLIANYMHPQAYGFLWGEKGDKVQFISSNTMELSDLKQYTIKEVKSVDKPTEFGAKSFEITFEEDFSSELDFSTALAIENLTWTAEVEFSNNIIRNNRARGALFSTPKKVICSNNVFDHTHGTAILLCGDANGWYETGACRNVEIKNNVFKNALTANYQFTSAVISIYPEIPNLQGQKKYFHSGIVIENNVFETFDAPILYAKSVDGLVFKNNVVKETTDFKPFHWNKNTFLLEKVKDVTFENNIFENKNRKNDIKFTLTEEKEIKIK